MPSKEIYFYYCVRGVERNMEYQHIEERLKRPSTPTIVKISIHLTLESISMQYRNFTEYYLCTMEYYEIVFSTSNDIPQTQNLRNK